MEKRNLRGLVIGRYNKCIQYSMHVKNGEWMMDVDHRPLDALLMQHCTVVFAADFFFLSFFDLTYSRLTSSLPSCLWSERIFPSLPGSRLTIFYRGASSALLQLVNQWLSFTYSRSHAFRYERKNTNPTLVRIELTTSVLAGVQVTY